MHASQQSSTYPTLRSNILHKMHTKIKFKQLQHPNFLVGSNYAGVEAWLEDQNYFKFSLYVTINFSSNFEGVVTL